MRRLKNIANRFGLPTLGVTYFVVICFALSSANTKTRLINFDKPEIITDYNITVHFIHGSVPKENCSYKKKRLGGYLGGHIEIEVNNFVYGFLYDSLPINYIPKSKFNSKFEKRHLSKWTELVIHDKVTSIEVPVTVDQLNNLDSLLNHHLNNAPYDYAFFGQRCTSSTAEILSDTGILNEFNNEESIIAFYYPKLLRRTMIKFAKKNQFRVKTKKGIECHDWE